MANGAAARYKIPALRFDAGFSPNCCAVRVQIEHCACAGKEEKTNAKAKIRKRKILFFIRLSGGVKVTKERLKDDVSFTVWLWC